MNKRNRASKGAMLAPLCGALLGLGSATCTAQGMPVQAIDVVHPGKLALAADRDSFISGQSISADGNLIVFRSSAGNLVPGDTDRRDDLFLLDRARNELKRISPWVDSESDGGGSVLRARPWISADGRWVYFNTAGWPDFPPTNPENPATHFYRYDVASGQTEAVPGFQAEFVNPSHFTRDGRHVLVDAPFPPDSPAGPENLRRVRLNLETGEMQPVDAGEDGMPMAWFSGLSSSGRFVCQVHESDGVFLVDLEGHLPRQRVDISELGAFGDEHQPRCVPSNDGERVAFVSSSMRLIYPFLPRGERLYLWQRSVGYVQLLDSIRQTWTPDAFPVFSDDGRQLTFALTADQNRPVRVIRWTPEQGLTDWLPRHPSRAIYPGRPSAAVSDDGSLLLIEALPDLAGAPNPESGVGRQLFLVSREDGRVERISAARGSPIASIPQGLEPQHNSICGLRPTLSHDGRLAAIVVTDHRAYLGPGDHGVPQVVLRDMQSAEPELISQNEQGDALLTGAIMPSMSSNGRFVVYSSQLPLGEAPYMWSPLQVFLRDRATGSTRLISADAAGVYGNDRSLCAVVSDDGKRVAFQSEATNLVSGTAGQEMRVYLWREEHPQLQLLSRSIGGHATEGRFPSMSSNGRRIVFESFAEDLVENDANPDSDLFLFQEGTAGLARITAASDVSGAGHIHQSAWLSANGRFVAFESSATFGFARHGSWHGLNVFVMDLETGEVDWVNGVNDPSDASIRLGVAARWPSLSADGRRVLMEVLPGAWTPGSQPQLEGIAPFALLDRPTRELRWVDFRHAHDGAIQPYEFAVLSGNGQYLAFEALYRLDGWSVFRAGPWPLRTAMWWDSAESGWGLATFDQTSAMAPVWYTNDEQGRPTWFIVPGLSPQPDGALGGSLLRFTGRPWWGEGPVASQAVQAGQVRLRFSPGERLDFDYQVDGVEGSKQLRPFALPQRIDCSDSQAQDRAWTENYTDMWYAGAAESGWGLQLFHAGPLVALGWYTYDSDRRATYFVGTASRRPDGGFAGTLFRPRDGLPLAAIDGLPASDGADPIGEVELRFADGERGEFRFRIDGLERSHAIQRLRFGSAASACSSRPWP